jgi:cell division protein ZapA
MAQVNVSISGKLYRMACDDGQEDHLGALADRLNATIDRLRGEFGEIGDQRLTVMAAITMADESSEADNRIRELTEKIAGIEEGRAEFVERQQAQEAAIAKSIDAAAEQIASLAERIAKSDDQENGG